MTTNFERIKAMSIDEMAEMLDYFNIDCTNCPVTLNCNGKCYDQLKQWLESEECE